MADKFGIIPALQHWLDDAAVKYLDEVDIEKLCIENEQRKAGFQQKIDSLNSVPQNITDWKRIKTAYDRMTEEKS